MAFFRMIAAIGIAALLLYLSPLVDHSLSSFVSDTKLYEGIVTHTEIINEEGSEIQRVWVKNRTEVLSVVDNYIDGMVQQKLYGEGDKVILSVFSGDNGEVIESIQDHERYGALYWLFAIFVVLVLLISGWQGVGSLVGLVFSFLVLFTFVLPKILEGGSPIIMVILGALLIIPANFIFAHGFNRKTLIAMVGTLLTIVVSGLLATYFADLLHLSGLASEEANFLKLDSQQVVDFRGLVLAGILVSVLGILDDVTISQCSVIQQLKNAKHKISFSELFSRSLQVGRDHISSLVNTLILVYAGASLPLLLLFLDQSGSFRSILNTEFMAEEIAQTLIGSIGLVLAVPITTLLGAVFIKAGEDPGHSCNH